MGKYTVRAGADFDARIDADLARVVERVRAMPESAAFLAIVLIGGYARGEGTPFLLDGERVPYNDYDLVVVGRDMSRAARQALQAKLTAVEHELTATLGIAVDLYLHTQGSLGRAEFALLNYEMFHGHRVVWGAADILAGMPEYPTAELPLEEGTRLLLNRGKLLLDIRARLERDEPLTPAERERFIKFLMKAALAWGDCVFIAIRQYEISYVAKRRDVDRLVPDDAPDREYLVRLYHEAIEFKEGGDLALFEGRSVADMYPEIRDYFLLFYDWFEAKRLGRPFGDRVAYVNLLPTVSRYPAAKCLALNVLKLRAAALRPAFCWLFVHPRNRLYGALPLLLAPDCPQPGLLRDLVGGEPVRQRFLDLRSRFS